MRVGVIGINHKIGSLKQREFIGKILQKYFGPKNSVHDDRGFLLISTCNRTEVYFSSDDLSLTHHYILQVLYQEIPPDEREITRKFYSFFGQECFEHLCKVTAGLDSAIIGETEIQGQVKCAYQTAAKYSQLPSEFHFIFQKALKIGKEIRSELLMEQRFTNLEQAIFTIGRGIFKKLSPVRVLLVGASKINIKILSYLKLKNLGDITITNRTDQVAQKMAEKHLLIYLPWSRCSEWHQYDWIIVGTSATEPLITNNKLPVRLNKPKLILDLSVPRNVESKVGQHPSVTLLNIDQISKTTNDQKKKMVNIIKSAENHLSIATHRQTEIFKKKQEYRLMLTTTA